MFFIITDYNTDTRYRYYGHRMDEDEVSQEAVAAMGDFPHYVDAFRYDFEVEEYYDQPWESFPELPVK